MSYLCGTEARRRLVEAHPTLNGVDYLEVLDASALAGSPRQRTLLVRFLKNAPLPPLTATNFEISGGERVTDVAVEWSMRADAPHVALTSQAERDLFAALPEPQQVVVLRTSSNGDHSTYTLHVVAGPGALEPPGGIDPLLSRVSFSFKVECPTDFDCEPKTEEARRAETPRINYLAKDYRSFRRLMLDRMTQTLPAWRERNPADLGVALVEVLAYVGDRLSYAQDAVATEAYLGTARRRISAQRHARLVDYQVHDGANARALVQVAVTSANVSLLRGRVQFTTRGTGLPILISPGSQDFTKLLSSAPVVFEPCHDQVLHEAHATMPLYAWGAEECCLPAGATRATLDGAFPDLAAGDIVIFEEVVSPETGSTADADPRHRWAVRLIDVAQGGDELAGTAAAPRPVTEIRWHEADALPFPIVINARVRGDTASPLISGVSRVLGNIVLADHGLSVADELGAVPQPHIFPQGQPAVPPRYRPVLQQAPLSQAAAVPGKTSAANTLLIPPLDTVSPAITLVAAGETKAWNARRDLLSSNSADPDFVVETEADGVSALRFGDGRNGRRPAPDTCFIARYRVGNGRAGNIGAEALVHVVTDLPGIVGVRNALPAQGGREPESLAEIRSNAPYAFRHQERAVTPEDYAALALRFPSVQRAAATFRWNGHGHTVFLTVDRFGERTITPRFEEDLIAFLDPFRMAGYDLEIDEPRYVALELELSVCARAGYFRSEVKRAVLETLGAETLRGGRVGLFHPDRMSFGEPVYLSLIVAEVQAIEGVESVTPTIFRRLDGIDFQPLDTGVLPIRRLEIARLANDPSFPERGRLTVQMGGGK